MSPLCYNMSTNRPGLIQWPYGTGTRHFLSCCSAIFKTHVALCGKESQFGSHCHVNLSGKQEWKEGKDASFL